MTFDQQELIQRALAQYRASLGGASTQHDSAGSETLPQQRANSEVDQDEKIESTPEHNTESSSQSDQESQPLNQLDKNALQSLEEAIMLLPENEREHYCKVKKEKPELIERESNPWWYLKFEKFNTWTAAKKLTCYWCTRFEIFGDRAMLPMNQTGEGALNKTDIQLLKTGFYAFPPPEKGGRAIVISDSSRRTRKKDSESVMRVFFYLGYVLLQNPLTPVEGFVVICLLSKSTFDAASRTMSERQRMGERCFPAVSHSVHAICKDEMALLQPVLDEAIQFCFDCFPRNKNKKYFHKRSQGNASLLQTLERDHGIPVKSIPECIGGQFTHDNFCHWRERQIRIEWDLPLGVLAQDGDEKRLPKVRPTSELNSVERKERKRRLNILHARRRRRRDRFDADFLNGQIENLEKEKAAHELEFAKLQSLLIEAQTSIQEYEIASKSSAPDYGSTKDGRNKGKSTTSPDPPSLHAKNSIQATSSDRELFGTSASLTDQQYAAPIANSNLMHHLLTQLPCTSPNPLASLIAQRQQQLGQMQYLQQQQFSQSTFDIAQPQRNATSALRNMLLAQHLTSSEIPGEKFTPPDGTMYSHK